MAVALLALALVLGFSDAGRAQGGAGGDVRPDAHAQPAADPTTVDASKLGVSMSRIRRGLRVTEAREQEGGTPLKLEYQVQVYGAAPRINILEGFNISKNAPLSYGAPTHADFIRQWTPQAFRSPRLPVSSMAGWALFQVAQRAEKSKCEQEIADYRAALMQGISMAAPRCTQ
jgi:hypothetical protein